MNAGLKTVLNGMHFTGSIYTVVHAYKDHHFTYESGLIRQVVLQDRFIAMKRCHFWIFVGGIISQVVSCEGGFINQGPL